MPDYKTKLNLAHAQYKLVVRFSKNGLAVITLISEENWWQFFLHIALRCLANHKNGKFMHILKCILWDFDKKSGNLLFLLSILFLMYCVTETFYSMSGYITLFGVDTVLVLSIKLAHILFYILWEHLCLWYVK